MRKGFLVAVVALLLAMPAFAFDVSPTQTPAEKVVKAAHVQAAPGLIRAILADNRLADGVELVTLSDDGKRLRSVRGVLSAPVSGNIETAARAFINAHAAMFNIPVNKVNDVLTTTKVYSDAEGHHAAFHMAVAGVPVHGATIEMHYDKSRRLQLINGSFPTINKVNNQVSLGRIEAMAAAMRALGTKKFRATPKAQLEIVAENNEGRAAFCVQMPSVDPLGDFEILIDADTGKEISRLNQMVFYRVDTVTGSGSAYLDSPLAGEPVNVNLEWLTTTMLKGLWADVRNEAAPRASNSQYLHIYPPADTHFDEAMMYHSLNRIHDLFKSFGFSGRDESMVAKVHFGKNYDNAYFSPWENCMAFGDGNRLNDLSKEAGVAWHEYSHAVLQVQHPVDYSAESGAINEGQADYFACSLNENPALGAWTVNKLNKPWMRNLTDNLHYPENIQNEVHADGRIWGVILWDLRTALGKQISDILIHKSHSYLNGRKPKFIDGMNAIVVADQNLNEGANKATILEVFKKRGVSSGSSAGTVLDGHDLRAMRTFNAVHGE